MLEYVSSLSTKIYFFEFNALHWISYVTSDTLINYIKEWTSFGHLDE